MVLPADMTTSAAAPSLMDDEFAAVTVPSAGLNAGFSFVILSIFTCEDVGIENLDYSARWF